MINFTKKEANHADPLLHLLIILIVSHRCCLLPLVGDPLHRVVILMILAVMPTISSKSRFLEFHVL